MLADLKDIVEKQGFEVETRSVIGTAKYEINKIADDEDFSINVVGAEQEHMMKAHLFGGLAYDIITFAKKPVLVVRLSDHYKQGETCISTVGCEFGDHILFPTDFSENADGAFYFLEKMVGDGVKKITLLHVQDKAKIIPHLEHKLSEFNNIDRERLENLKNKLTMYGDAEIKTLVRLGPPAIEIVNLVRELNVQLVVMGSQGIGFVEELFLGSVSNIVARRSDSSVLLIPSKSH